MQKFAIENKDEICLKMGVRVGIFGTFFNTKLLTFLGSV